MTTFRTPWDTAPNPAFDIWTTTNGGEVIPGVVSPLMATLFTRADTRGQRALLAPYPSAGRIPVFDPPVGNFFGVTAGRICLNMGYTAAAMSGLDAEIAQAMLLQFFTGVEGAERFIVEATDDERAAAYEIVTRQRAEAPDRLEAVEGRLLAERSSDRAGRERNLSLAAAWQRLQDIFDENATGIVNLHYIVSTAAGEFQVRLAGVLIAAGRDPLEAIGLTSGLGQLESSRPAMALYELARAARGTEVAEVLRGAGVEAAIARLQHPSEPWRSFSHQLHETLVRWGYRGQGEVDPTNPDWQEDPRFALSQVRSMLSVPEHDSPEAQAARALSERKIRQREVRNALPAELVEVFDTQLARAQHFTRMRERTKAAWVMAARRARIPYLALADGLVESGHLDDPDDTRFLFPHEIDIIVDSGTGPDDLADRVAERRRIHVEAHEWILPDTWIGEAEPIRRGESRPTDHIQGVGVSAGEGPVTGTARIIESAEAGLARDIDPGEVLVAPFTDAPWTPLFITAAAVVVETGGVLSHAATVAREFGIPCVVMAADATRIIADGQRVTVDGASGLVTLG